MARRPRELASVMAELPVSPTHYELLGVASEATMNEIRAAWQKLSGASVSAIDSSDAAIPDVSALAASASSAQPDVQLAFAVLTDPMRRRVYDAFLVSHRQVTAQAARWWRRPAVWRRLIGALVALSMLAAIAAVGRLVWRLFTL